MHSDGTKADDPIRLLAFKKDLIEDLKFEEKIFKGLGKTNPEETYPWEYKTRSAEEYTSENNIDPNGKDTTDRELYPKVDEADNQTGTVPDKKQEKVDEIIKKIDEMAVKSSEVETYLSECIADLTNQENEEKEKKEEEKDEKRKAEKKKEMDILQQLKTQLEVARKYLDEELKTLLDSSRKILKTTPEIKNALWIPLNRHTVLFASHRSIVKRHAKKHKAHW